MRTIPLLLLVLASCTAAAVASPDETHLEEEDKYVNALDEVEDGEDGDSDGKIREGKIFALKTSTSRTLIASTTVYRLSTCISAISATPCVGRRKRNVMHDVNPTVMMSSDGGLSSSIDEAMSPKAVEDNGYDRDGKKILTVWSTGYTTITVSSTSYYQGITVSVSLACLPPGGIGLSCWG